MSLKLGDLIQIVENDAKRRGAWPKNPEQAGMGYYYAYGQLLAELESKWQWDKKRGRGRYYREGVRDALSYLLRNYLLLRIAGPLRGVGVDIPVELSGGVTPVTTCLILLGDMPTMLNRPSLFFQYIRSLCVAHKVNYQDVLVSLAKGGA